MGWQYLNTSVSHNFFKPIIYRESLNTVSVILHDAFGQVFTTFCRKYSMPNNFAMVAIAFFLALLSS